jgi:hypothetical protein
MTASPFIRLVLIRTQVHADRIELTISRNRLQQWLIGDSTMKERIGSSAADSDTRPITLSIPARLKRAGKEMKIIVDDGSDPVTPTRAWSACSCAPMSSVNGSARSAA